MSMTVILKAIKDLINKFRKGDTVNETQQALFRLLVNYGKEIDRRVDREAYAIDLKIALAEQAIKFYGMFPDGGPITEEERKFETSRHQALLPGFAKEKEDKAREMEEFRATYQDTVSTIIRAYPGIDKGVV